MIETIKNKFIFRTTPPQSTTDYTTANVSSEAYNYYDTSSYWSSYSAWQQGYYDSEHPTDSYNNYMTEQKPEEDDLELVGKNIRDVDGKK